MRNTKDWSNFVESQDASSTKDFIQKLSIALREARETLYWLKVIERTKLLAYDEIEGLVTESEEIVSILVSSIKKQKPNYEKKLLTSHFLLLTSKGFHPY